MDCEMRYLEETTRLNAAGDRSAALLMRIRRYLGDTAQGMERGDVEHLSRLIDYHFETQGRSDLYGEDEAWYAAREAQERREALESWGDQ